MGRSSEGNRLEAKSDDKHRKLLDAILGREKCPSVADLEAWEELFQTHHTGPSLNTNLSHPVTCIMHRPQGSTEKYIFVHNFKPCLNFLVNLPNT